MSEPKSWDDALATLRRITATIKPQIGLAELDRWLEANKHRAAEKIGESEERTTDE